MFSIDRDSVSFACYVGWSLSPGFEMSRTSSTCRNEMTLLHAYIMYSEYLLVQALYCLPVYCLLRIVHRQDVSEGREPYYTL